MNARLAPPAPDVEVLATRLQRLEDEVTSLRARLAATEAKLPDNSLALCLVSGDFERAMTALMLATTAASMAMDVSVFFAFWGVQAIKRSRRFRGKRSIEKALTAVISRDIGGLPSQKLNFGGLGPAVFVQLMKSKGVASPADLLETAVESGVRLQACTTSMDILGISADELHPSVVCSGSSQFIERASRASVSLIL